MRFEHVRLGAPEDRLPELLAFYGDRLGLASDASTVTAGETRLAFVAAEGEPFYHFALLVPGNRFDGALGWARDRVTLLPARDSGDVVFDFDFWDARACYFHDPAGNIVELVAHHGVDETDVAGDFGGRELVGLSELGLVGDQRAMAASIADGLGLALWDGTLDDPRALAFVGEKARTLILAPAGRGWLPTGRSSELHEVEARLSGGPPGEALLEEGRYRISR
jgi:catechol 2,3-dioxygenase-like lactoylglutathione lyase family enzyme